MVHGEEYRVCKRILVICRSEIYSDWSLKEAILLGVAAVLVAIIASLIPAITYARATIVSAKRRQARTDRAPLWQRWFLDVGLLGLAGYGYYLFYERQMLTFQTE